MISFKETLMIFHMYSKKKIRSSSESCETFLAMDNNGGNQGKFFKT